MTGADLDTLERRILAQIGQVRQSYPEGPSKPDLMIADARKRVRKTIARWWEDYTHSRWQPPVRIVREETLKK